MAEAQSYRHPSIDLHLWQQVEHDQSVIIADGHDIRVQVRAGHLAITDGPPGQQRIRRIARQPRTVSRLLVLAGHGLISAEAIRWMTWAQLPWAMLDEQSGNVIAGGGPARTDARLLRAQAYAPHEETGLRITGYLLSGKIRGQANILREIFRAVSVARMLDEYADSAAAASSLDDMRAFEGNAAAAYWAVWSERIVIPWREADRQRIPEHWQRFTSRASLRWDYASNMAATDPANAMLNYSYRVAESEAVHVCHALGLSPVLGILHADKAGRDSMALDLIEAIRPDCDRLILAKLDIGLGAKALDRRHFTESYEGQCWLVPPLTHELASHAKTLGLALRPHAEYVARLLANAAEGSVKIPRARKSRNAVRVTEKGRTLKAAVCLRDGITVVDILPEPLWCRVQRFVPEPPRKRTGRQRDDNDREVIAGLAVHELLGVSWSRIPLNVSESTYRARLLEYQWSEADGATAWEHMSEAIQAAGHLPSLVSVNSGETE